MTDILSIPRWRGNIFIPLRIFPSEANALATVTPASVPSVRRATTRVNVVITRAENCATRAVPCTTSGGGPRASTSLAMSASVASVTATRTSATLIRRLSRRGKVRIQRANILEEVFVSTVVTRRMESIVKNVYQDTSDLLEFLSSVGIRVVNVRVTLPEVRDRKSAIPTASWHTRVTRPEIACVGRDSPEPTVTPVPWATATIPTVDRVPAR